MAKRQIFAREITALDIKLQHMMETESDNTTEPVTSENECNSSLFPVNTEEWEAVTYCKHASASISIIGCVFTLFVLVFYKRYQQFTQRLIMNLCVAAILEAACFFFVSSHPDIGQNLCKLQAAWLQYCLWAVLLWTGLIAINLMLNIMWNKTVKKYELMCTLFCWGFPFVTMSIPLNYGENYYGPSGPWCWLGSDRIYWKIGLWYSWAFVSFVAIFLLIVVKNCKPGTHATEGALYFNFKQQQAVIQDIHIMRAHHAVFFFLILVLFPFVNDIYFVIHCNYSLALLLLESLSVPFVGGAITVSFLLDKSTRYVLHPKVITEMLRRRFKIIDEWFEKERTTSCDTAMIDIFASTTSGEASSRESVNSHFLDRHGNTDLLDIIREETSETRGGSERQSRRNTGDSVYRSGIYGSRESINERNQQKTKRAISVESLIRYQQMSLEANQIIAKPSTGATAKVNKNKKTDLSISNEKLKFENQVVTKTVSTTANFDNRGFEYSGESTC